jgi:hypothetical protein
LSRLDSKLHLIFGPLFQALGELLMAIACFDRVLSCPPDPTEKKL